MKLVFWVAAAIVGALLLWAIGTAVMWECSASGGDCFFSKHNLVYRYQGLLSGIFALSAALLVFWQGREQIAVAKAALEHERQISEEERARRRYEEQQRIEQTVKNYVVTIRAAQREIQHYRGELAVMSLRRQHAYDGAVSHTGSLRPFNPDLADWITRRMHSAEKIIGSNQVDHTINRALLHLDVVIDYLEACQNTDLWPVDTVRTVAGREAFSDKAAKIGMDVLDLDLDRFFN